MLGTCSSWLVLHVHISEPGGARHLTKSTSTSTREAQRFSVALSCFLGWSVSPETRSSDWLPLDTWYRRHTFARIPGHCIGHYSPARLMQLSLNATPK